MSPSHGKGRTTVPWAPRCPTGSCGVSRAHGAATHTEAAPAHGDAPGAPQTEDASEKLSSFLNCPLLCAQRPCGAQGPGEPHDEAVREERGGTLGSGESVGGRPAHGSRCVHRTEAWATWLGLAAPRDCPLWPCSLGHAHRGRGLICGLGSPSLCYNSGTEAPSTGAHLAHVTPGLAGSTVRAATPWAPFSFPAAPAGRRWAARPDPSPAASHSPSWRHRRGWPGPG